MEYEVVIGLETHIELNTKTKVFCSCKNEFGGEPNTHCCPICIGLPGSLPMVNKEAIKKIISVGLATNCEINKKFGFNRKHYFYPDLPKAYQITQNDTPLCVNGYVEIVGDNGSPKKIRIRQIHLEEDAGKLIHSNLGETYIDYNRGGVPLIEIVSQPDISSSQEAMQYLNYLKDLVKHIGASDCKMEQGSLRCDVNVSLKRVGSKEFGDRTEMKNINSFKAIERAINFEVNRQKEILNNGGTIITETRRWDDQTGQNYTMRSKEGAKDYRFMPEPDIPTIQITDEFLKEIKDSMPLLPREVKEHLKNDYKLSEYDASLIAKDEVVTKFFYDCVKQYPNAKKVVNWITSEINKKLNLSLEQDIVIPLNPTEFVKILKHVDNGELSQMGSRTLFDKIWDDPTLKVDELIDKLGLKLEKNDSNLEEIVKGVIENNPKAVEDFKSGKNKNAFAFFIGQVMKATRGQADATKVNELVTKYLK